MDVLVSIATSYASGHNFFGVDAAVRPGDAQEWRDAIAALPSGGKSK